MLPVAVDAEHFGHIQRKDPHERLGIPDSSGVHPRIGFAGVVDGRFDWAMVRDAAQSTPNWQWIIVGPRDSITMPPDPMALPLDGAHEVAGVGVLAPDESGKPILHIHGALGRSGQTITGCLRKGAKTWLMLEAVMVEILDANAVRVKNPETGFVELNVR